MENEFTNKQRRRLKYHEQYRQIGRAVAYFRKKRKFTQEQLAKLAGLSRTHISNIEAPNINAHISLDSLFDISKALDVSPAEFFKDYE